MHFLLVREEQKVTHVLLCPIVLYMSEEAYTPLQVGTL